ncbi:MAG: hypothetical protein ACPLX8_02260, partial [Nanopusillaceae archaeon]
CKKSTVVFNKENKVVKVINKPKEEGHVNLRYILDSQPLSLLNKKLCDFDESLCSTSTYLSKDRYVKKYFTRMYVSILLHESLNFKYNQNPNNPNIIGFAQINTQLWNINKLRKFGYNISNVNELYDPEINIKIGQMIFWHNLVVAYSLNPNKKTILDYASSYYSLSMPKWYTDKIATIFFDKQKIEKVLDKNFER